MLRQPATPARRGLGGVHLGQPGHREPSSGTGDDRVRTDHERGCRGDECEQCDDDSGGRHGIQPRQLEPQQPVLGGGDIVHHATDDVAAALSAETSGCRPVEVLVDADAVVGHPLEGDIVDEESFAVPEHCAADAEEPNGDDRDHQVHHRRMLRGTHDEPCRRQQQTGCRQLGGSAESRSGRETPPHAATMSAVVRWIERFAAAMVSGR